jgi:hypothetical protein
MFVESPFLRTTIYINRNPLKKLESWVLPCALELDFWCRVDVLGRNVIVSGCLELCVLELEQNGRRTLGE